MDAISNLSLPSPQANDSSEVQTALTAAQSLWSRDPREALRWLRKAAEGASDAGDDQRSVQLARAAAELRNFANLGPSLPPPGADGTPAPGLVAARPAANQNPGRTLPATPAAAAAAAAMNVATDARTPAAAITQPEIPVNVAMANFAAAAAANALSSRQTDGFQPLPVAPAAQPSAEEAAFQAAQQAAAFQATQQAAAQQAAAQAVQLGAVGASGGTGTDAAPISAPPASSPPVSSPPSAPHFMTHRSVRVALSPTPNSEGEFCVHPLAEGETAPPGWKDALLVALEPGERLFPGRN